MSWAHLLGFVAVLVVDVVYSQNDTFNLELIDIVPCQESNQTRNVSLYESDILAVDANLTLCHGTGWSFNQYNGFRLHARSDEANASYPVVFVARQSTHGTISFSIPLQPTGFSVAFIDVSRTVCPITYQKSSIDAPLFYIDVFTSSPQLQNYSISVEPVENFTLQLDERYSTVITPSSPQIFYFNMPVGIDEVTIETTTDSKMCAIVSVQNVTCPVNDLLENARSIGIFQTMSTSSFLTVDVSQVNDREFLVVLIATNYSICHSANEINDLDTLTKNESVVNSSSYQQELNIIIKQLKPISDHLFAILLPMFVVFPLFSLVIIFLLFDCFPNARCEPLYKRPFCCLVIKCICPLRFLCWCSDKQYVCTCPPCMHKEDGEKKSLTDNEQGAGKYQSMDKDEVSNGSQEAMNYELGSKIDDESKDEDGKIDLLQGQHHVATTEIKESDLRLSRMNTRKYEHLEDQYCLYGWNTVTVGIFYALPALQLVLSEQKILNLSGDQDECYYNFECAHPLSFPFFSVQFHFNTFNNVWSNIGYVLLGFLFIILVLIRRYMYRKQRRLDKLYTDSHGVPQFFGIYFAMGFALILEGFMSSFYHICPSDSNFQFDTAFMFIIGGLLLVKIFQNRHPDIHANAFIAFFSFAIIIFFTLFGIYFGRKNPVPVRLLIFVLALLLLLIFLVSFYYFHNWKWSKAVLMKAVMNIKDFFTCKSGPSHRIRFIKLITAFVMNLVLAILVVALSRINIAMAVLAFFLLNLLFFLAVYVLFKLWFREPLTWLALVLPLFIAVVWATAFYFFKVVPVTEWKLTPAESRELNKECTLLGFYDNHDIWHFLSAVGMFLAFLFLLVLDDGVADVKRENLRIF